MSFINNPLLIFSFKLLLRMLSIKVAEYSVSLKCYWPLNNYSDLANKTMHGY